MSTITMSVCLCCSCHCKICDETNQSKGFAVIAMMGGFGRLFVCVIGSCDVATLLLYTTGLTHWRISGTSSQQVSIA